MVALRGITKGIDELKRRSLLKGMAAIVGASAVGKAVESIAAPPAVAPVVEAHPVAKPYISMGDTSHIHGPFHMIAGDTLTITDVGGYSFTHTATQAQTVRVSDSGQIRIMPWGGAA